MPKPAKKQPKSKMKAKRKEEPKPPSITTKKSYWLTLMLVVAVASVVFEVAMNGSPLRIALLALMAVVLIGVIGYVRVNPSTLTLSRRATFLFIGASVIGFGIWAAIVLASNATGFTLQIDNWAGGDFFGATSFVTCLSAGAFVGELIGKNGWVQARMFSNMN